MGKHKLAKNEKQEQILDAIGHRVVIHCEDGTYYEGDAYFYESQYDNDNGEMELYCFRKDGNSMSFCESDFKSIDILEELPDIQERYPNLFK